MRRTCRLALVVSLLALTGFGCSGGLVPGPEDPEAIVSTSAALTSIVSPTPGSALTQSSVTFEWPSSGAEEYAIWVGRSVGTFNITNRRGLTGTSATFTNLPVDGSTLFVRMWDRFGATWSYTDHTYTAWTTTVPAMTAPAAGSTFGGTSQSFTWTAGADEYALWLGSSLGSYNIYAASSLGTATSVTVNGLPVNGTAVYARFWYRIGQSWYYTSISYTAWSAAASPAVTAPVSGSTFTGTTATFTWGSGAEEYALWVGSALGAYDIWARSSLGTATSANVTGLPLDGRTLYVRFHYRYGTTWTRTDYTYQAWAASAPAITSPVPSSTLSSAEATFGWEAGAEEYALWIGSGVGAFDLWARSSLGTATSAAVSGLPVDGRTLYVRLHYRFGAGWSYTDYTYKAWAAPSVPSVTSPTPGSVLSGGTATFEWGAGADEYAMWIGNSVGTFDLWARPSLGTATTVVASGLPIDGRMLYVRFYYRFGASWLHTDYTYTATSISAPSLTNPTPGSTLTGTTETFEWDAGANNYALWVGAAVGSSNIAAFSSLGAVTSKQVNGLPTDGSTVYVRFWYDIGGWRYTDYSYTAATLGGCSSASECPGVDTECGVRTCIARVCGMSFTASGTATASQTAGDCMKNQCDGNGGIEAAVDNVDVPVDGNECTDDVCTNGVPSNPARTGAACGTGGTCNSSGQCVTPPTWTYVVGFEDATKGSYTSGTVTLTGISWNMTDALIGTEANEFKIGTKSARLRGYNTSAITMQANKSSGLGTITFQYRRYNTTDTQATWAVDYSLNDGSTWTQVGNAFSAPASDDVSVFQETVNVSGPVRVRIRCTSTGVANRRLNIDEIKMSDAL